MVKYMYGTAVKFLLLILCFSLLFISCPISDGGGKIISDSVEIAGVSDDSYFQTYDGTNGFTHNISTFRIAQYELTYSLWYEVKTWAEGSGGYTFANPGREGDDGVDGDTPTPLVSEPVTFISWRDAIIWCNAYSEREGMVPSYRDGTTDAVLRDATDGAAVDAAVCHWEYNGFRLPTEGEWQYAAGNMGATPWNYAAGASADTNNAAETQAVAWYVANAGGHTQNVGTTTRGTLSGLWDMSGNVNEWCWDWMGSYPAGMTTDYRGAAPATDRVMRGGAYAHTADFLPIGRRSNVPPDTAGAGIGFRIAQSN